LKKHKPRFDEGLSSFLDQRKEAKLQRLQDPIKTNGDNLNNIRREISSHFRNKKRECVTGQITELARNRKNNNITDLYRGIHKCKRGYPPRSNLVKDENSDLLAHSHYI
jgi:uncharacterized protein YaaR (DUF327 family)